MKCSCKNNFDKNLIEELAQCQDSYGYISDENIKAIAKKFNKSEAEIFGVLTFYKQFTLEKSAKYSIVICAGTSCFVMGSQTIALAISSELGISMGEKTQDGKFSLEQARCFGCCALAPLMVINGKVYGKLDAQKAVEIIRGLK